MKNAKLLQSILLASGLLGTCIGLAVLLVPVEFFATTGIELGSNASLLSEVRAPGGALLACGVLIMAGAFVTELRFTAALVSALLYLSYGASRLLSMAADGMPDDGLVAVTALELLVGLVCVFAFVRTARGAAPRQGSGAT